MEEKLYAYSGSNFNLANFISSLSNELKAKVVAVQHVTDNIKVHFSENPTGANDIEIATVLSSHDSNPNPYYEIPKDLSAAKALRVQSLFESPKTHAEIEMIDITLLGLHQAAWDYSRGARTVREYDHSSVMFVDHVYTYTMDAGNRNISTLSSTINWYSNDGTIGLSKTIQKEMTIKALGQLNQEIRKGRMTDLRENAKAVAGGQALIDALYGWYGTEIYSYEEIGSLDFENALKDEADPVRLGTLNTSIPEFGGLGVMQLLSFQLIGAYSWT